MSDSFKDREKGFENKFAHDMELQFRATARRNRLVGHWAAQLQGLTGEAEASYAIEVVKADFEEAGDEDVVRKLVRDLGNLADEATIRAKITECFAVAKAQLMNETS
jgi:hypothetical protein